MSPLYYKEHKVKYSREPVNWKATFFFVFPFVYFCTNYFLHLNIPAFLWSSTPVSAPPSFSMGGASSLTIPLHLLSLLNFCFFFSLSLSLPQSLICLLSMYLPFTEISFNGRQARPGRACNRTILNAQMWISNNSKR